MAAEDQGIMSLPMEGEAASQNMPQLPLEESYDAVQQGLQNASPQAAADVQQLLASITPQLDQLSDEELNTLLQIVQYLYDGGEEQYAKRLQEVIAAGAIDAGDLPDEYDPEVLSSIGTVLLQAIRQRQGSMQAEQGPMPTGQEPMPPAQFARGGIAEAARMVASKGRYGDTMLAHITPEEARLLKKRGGAGTINPETGLPEFFLKKFSGLIKKVVKSVVKQVKTVLKSPIGRVIATVALSTFLPPPLASALVTAAGGGNTKEILTSAATAYFGAPGGTVSQYVTAAGITNAAANAAITAGIVGTGAGLLSGQKLSDAVKSGLVAGATSGVTTGLQQGFTTQPPGGTPAPTDGRTLPPVEDRFLPASTYEGARTATSVSPLAPVPPAAQVPPAAPTGTSAPAGISASAEMYSPYAFPSQAGAAPAGSPTMMDTAKGFYQKNISPLMDTAKDFYQKNISPSGIREQAIPAAQTAGSKAVSDLMTRMPDATPAMKEAAYQSAYKAAMPGVIGTYGPAVGAGLGIMGLAGGFSPNQPQPSALANQMRGTPGLDLINRNPNQYLVQGLPGVQYTPEGNISGTSAWSPSATMGDVQVATPSYTGGIFGFSPAPRYPGNPYFAADGGLASLANGGYPRKTGAISGPGTEKSDSIPAMLSDGEFVMTAKAVRGIGGGSRRAGAKKMYALMHQLERNASRG